MNDDWPPRLSFNLPRAHVVAKRDGAVMLGGLGAMGLGTMWHRDDGSYCDRDGYNTAPIVGDDFQDGFGSVGP